MPIKPFAAMLALMMGFSVQAADQVVTLEDGRKVILHDDFTWQYLAPETPRADQAAKPLTPEAASAIPALPKAAAQPKTKTMPKKPLSSGVIVRPGEAKDVMQLSDFGLDALLGRARYEGGELIIPTSVTNQGREAIIQVDVRVTVMDEFGQVLGRETLPLWRSIKRMADTYLRPGTSKAGLELRMAVEKRDLYQLQVEIDQVETR
ncbi:DUF3157 family protein [Ferrimonas sediminicola]|uniref:DUF3157 family protein n=1 Tax=Ferrimonas sediminicola TaxID=2569538 RepID=A0A4U1BFE3_9GAMM|nr:DUF3157 family protein [Ferrimonas sediminicola]TKB49397.1 DUF3157 family protein [Ferrimonas sediminicola]